MEPTTNCFIAQRNLYDFIVILKQFYVTYILKKKWELCCFIELKKIKLE